MLSTGYTVALPAESSVEEERRYFVLRAWSLSKITRIHARRTRFFAVKKVNP